MDVTMGKSLTMEGRAGVSPVQPGGRPAFIRGNSERCAGKRCPRCAA